MLFREIFVETLTYILESDHEDFINPTECRIFEEFREESKFIGRIFREKVPNKQLYIIMKRKGEGTFPEILDSTSNIRTASNKILKYSIRWIGELKKKEGNLDLLLDYKIIDNTYIKLRQEYNKKFS